jgi:hypothetical protein
LEPLEPLRCRACGPVADGRPQKCFGIGEVLADQAEPDGLAIALNQAAGRLRGKQRLGQCR